MNVLVLDDEWPSEFSGKFLRIKNIFSRLSSEANLIYLFIGNTPPKNTQCLKEIFNSVEIESTNINSKTSQIGRFLNVLTVKPGEYKKWKNKKQFHVIKNKIEEVVFKNNVDIIHTFSYFTAQYIPNLANVLKIWDVGDSYYLNDKRALSFLSFKEKILRYLYALRLYNYEQEMIKKFNKTIFVSTNDGLVHNNLMDRISIVPNGVDTEYFKISEQNNVENNSIIFTGHMNFLPNIQAVLFFINQIFPIIKREIPQLKFYIVGAEPPKEIFDFHGRDGIIVTGAVKDIRPYLARAALFIAPMISGAGIKNKILQAMAMSKPIISTQLGIEALNVADNKELIIANNPLDFANKTVFLLQDKALRDSLGLYARHKVEKDYKWEELITKYKRIYMENLSCCS